MAKTNVISTNAKGEVISTKGSTTKSSGNTSTEKKN